MESLDQKLTSLDSRKFEICVDLVLEFSKSLIDFELSIVRRFHVLYLKEVDLFASLVLESSSC